MTEQTYERLDREETKLYGYRVKYTRKTETGFEKNGSRVFIADDADTAIEMCKDVDFITQIRGVELLWEKPITMVGTDA